MSDTTNNESVYEVEDNLEMLPDGWGPNDDIFDVENWRGESETADASGEDTETDEANTDDTADEDGAPTTGEDEDAEDSAEDTEDAPTTGEDDEPRILTFQATIDHTTSTIELDEADLPAIYQKAAVTDRVQAKLSKVTPIYNKAERAAKALGYESAEEMLTAALDNYRDSEVEKLVGECTPRRIAEDYVGRQLDQNANGADVEEVPDTPSGRDFRSEAVLLLQLYPELKGKELPDEVLKASIENNEPLVVTYKRYADEKQKAVNDASKAETKKLKKDNKILKQNAEAASRAPVRGVAKGGPVQDPEDDDPFLKGFNEDY